MTNLTLAICTYNRAAILGRALDSIRDQVSSLPCCEVLIVDNDSRDDTRQVVSSYQQNIPNLRYVLETHPGISHARNRALSEGKGEHLAFLDDDAWAEVNWLPELMKPLESQDPPPACVVGPVQLVWDGSRPRWFPPEHEPLLCRYDMGPQPHFLGPDGYLLTTNALFHRQTLLNIGGFQTNLGRVRGVPIGGEDNEICQRLIKLGNAVFYQPTALVFHPVPRERQTLRYLVHRLYWDGASQPLLDSGVGCSTRHYLRQGFRDLRRIARFAFDGCCALAGGDRHKRLDSVLSLVQRLGRLRTHLMLAAGRMG